MSGANEIMVTQNQVAVKDGAREVALKKLREIKEKNLEGAASMKRKEQRESAQRAFKHAFCGLCMKKFYFKEEDFAQLTVEDMYEIHKDLKRRAKIYSKIQSAAILLIPVVGWIWFLITYDTDDAPKYCAYRRNAKFLEKEYGPDWFQKIAKDLYN